jgi:hypothetical protein
MFWPNVTNARYANNPNRQITPAEVVADVDEDGVGDTSNEGFQGDEHTYCYCNGVSYGEMVACDRQNCAREWYSPFTTSLTVGSIWSAQN